MLYTLPWSMTDTDKMRRVGVEIEMAEISLEAMAEAIHKEFGGHIHARDAFLQQVQDTQVGDFTVELDARVLRDQSYLQHLQQLGITLSDTDRTHLDQWLAKAAGRLVPHEIVAPPLTLDALPRLDRVRAALHAQGAKGTQSSLHYAFGLQLNIEVHSQDATWILNILQAFVLLYAPLTKMCQIDLARKLSPYIKPFPGAYVRQILQPDYAPDISTLIDDYLLANPTRNRPLDLLPLFAEIDTSRVMAAPVEHALIKARPALHYRLPNCEIDNPQWSLAKPFKGWARIEQLAADTPKLRQLSAEYLRQPVQALGQWADSCSKQFRDWF